MFVRPLSVAAIGALALAAAILFGSGCDQLEELVKEVEAQHGGGGGQPGGGTGGSSGGVQCRTSQDCPAGTTCSTDRGVMQCDLPPACKDANPPIPCFVACYGTCEQVVWEDACNSDAECRIQADTCTGCDCRAIDPNTPPAVCDGPGVQCLVDPCAGKTAKCVNHACIVADAPTR
jgi:hypothetical protein